MPDHLQPVFRALGDPTRRDILRMLGDTPMTIAEVSDRFDMTRAAVKKHLVVLSDGGLISVTPRGREKVNTLNPLALKPALDWLGWFDQLWDARLTALKSAIETDLQKETDNDAGQHNG